MLSKYIFGIQIIRSKFMVEIRVLVYGTIYISLIAKVKIKHKAKVIEGIMITVIFNISLRRIGILNTLGV